MHQEIIKKEKMHKKQQNHTSTLVEHNFCWWDQGFYLSKSAFLNKILKFRETKGK